MPMQSRAESKTEDIVEDLRSLRIGYQQRILKKLEKRDPELPETLILTTAGLLEAHFSLNFLAERVGTSRTSIDRWSRGQNVPRAPGYRIWVVQTMLKLLRDAIQGHEEEEVKEDKVLGEPVQPLDQSPTRNDVGDILSNRDRIKPSPI